jgi:alpha-tubulin suppressor-like RCC1 family protein
MVKRISRAVVVASLAPLAWACSSSTTSNPIVGYSAPSEDGAAGSSSCDDSGMSSGIGSNRGSDAATPLTGVTAISVSDGSPSACAVLSGGTVQCWGANGLGILGNGMTTGPDTCVDCSPCSPTPVTVRGLAGATAISVGIASACALLSDGTVQCWGDQTFGVLGSGTTGPDSCCIESDPDGGCPPVLRTPCAAMPVAVTGVTDATAVSVGWTMACALISGGTVQCWGPGAATPVAVTGLAGVVAISVSGGSACALLSGGTVECWGDNSYGELGNGTVNSSATPVAVGGLTGATAISVGDSSACALLSGGTVECWGDNSKGQLGDSTTTGPDACCVGAIDSCTELAPCSPTPVAIPGLTDATAISAGSGSVCALLSGGTVQCWGAGGPPPSSLTPLPVMGLSAVTAVSVGEGSACALLANGGVQCWGDNSSGALGNGSTASQSTPVAVQ